ncbi:MAG TPA: hypothetical protein DCG57_16480 [Candidatus Riflebacteria bacterium]|jgi:UDP-N-acetylmuramyl pentapeptide phosphotransferase/UDP-N-acetylglucosamine-1-phosphate transferase|nr:hypothetical protein [Candidatus Riflebacteria bacterium]
MLNSFLPSVVAFLLSMVVSYILASSELPFNSLDVPGKRSLHERPTPRLGGVAILLGIIAGWMVAHATQPLVNEFVFFAGAAVLVAAVSVADDFFTLSQIARFIVHLLACGLVLFGCVYENTGWPLLVFYAIATIWLVNLYNFMDGMDGFSGGMAVIGFSALGLAAWFSGATHLSMMISVVAAAALGFLVFNFPPARIFMGDVGSATLGFLVAGFSLWGINEQAYAIWLPLLIFSPFIVDASVTILRRAFNREKIWMPHRKHFYQRLVQNGWSHRKTVLCEYVLMLACAGSALAMHYYQIVAPGLVAWAVIYLVLAVVVERKVRDRVPF